MNLYTIYDRLLSYYMPPFVAADDKAVMHSLAAIINNQESDNAIAQAPHHYQLWSIAKIEDSTVTAETNLVCDCASLVREGVRSKPEPRQEALRSPIGGRGAPGMEPQQPARTTPSAP